MGVWVTGPLWLLGLQEALLQSLWALGVGDGQGGCRAMILAGSKEATGVTGSEPREPPQVDPD